MSVRVARGVLTPSQGYVCLSCRSQNPGVEKGRTRGYRYSAPGDSNEAPKAPGELSTETGKDEYSATRRAFRDMIRGFMFGNDPVGSKTKGIQHETTQEPKAEPKGVENVSSFLQRFGSIYRLGEKLFTDYWIAICPKIKVPYAQYRPCTAEASANICSATSRADARDAD